MLQLDEYDQLLVANPFANDSPIVSSINKRDTFSPLTLDSASGLPLRTQSVSLSSIPPVTIIDGEEETRAGSTPLVVSAEEDRASTCADRASKGGNNTITHSVGPNDSFAGVALRYGVSIAALRRANQLWPSDPIHLRTELLIPRGDTRPTKRKLARRVASMGVPLRSIDKQTPSRSPDLIASSFFAARNIIFSVLPARLSLDSLSSKTSASADHELDDLQVARTRKTTHIQPPFVEQGLELSTISSPSIQYRHSAAPMLPQVPHSPTMQHPDLNYVSPRAGSLRSPFSSSSPAASLERLPRSHPFAVRPVRTSQLAPEPAMELPVRRPRS